MQTTSLVIITGARTLSTAIASHLAQGDANNEVELLNHPIESFHHPDPKQARYMPHDHLYDEYHTKQVIALVESIKNRKKHQVIHLVSGFVTTEDLFRLKEAGAMICMVIRLPEKQMASFETLPTNPAAGTAEELKNAMVEYTWENLLVFACSSRNGKNLIDFVIKSEEYCTTDAESYRERVFIQSGLPYHRGTELTKHRDAELLEKCGIMGKIPIPIENKLNNAWNGRAATTRQLMPDTRVVEEKNLTEWQKRYLPRARHIYKLLCGN